MAKRVKTVAKKKRKSAAAKSSKKSRASKERIGVLKTYKIYVNGKFPRTESGRYYIFESASGDADANVCLCTRKDLREAVVAARGAFGAWSAASPYLRGQIVYRIAEMLEGRKDQFVAELKNQGTSAKEAANEVNASIDRLIYYAGWADKYQQVFSSVNPVSQPYFNFTIPDPTGVVTIIAPQDSGLLGLVSNIAPAIIGGNTCVVLASSTHPLSAVTLGEVLHSSDVPPGVVNILTGSKKELLEHFASHMDVNATIYCGTDGAEVKQVQTLAALNVKRIIVRDSKDLESSSAQSPYEIVDTQEFKTTWHPIGI